MDNEVLLREMLAVQRELLAEIRGLRQDLARSRAAGEGSGAQPAAGEGDALVNRLIEHNRKLQTQAMSPKGQGGPKRRGW